MVVDFGGWGVAIVLFLVLVIGYRCMYTPYVYV